MRVSDQILHDDLADAGLPELAARAAAGEWNDYFSQHDAPQHHLIDTLKAEIKLANITRKRLILNVVDGKYDGTKAESDEWAASPEGRETFALIAEGLRRQQ